MLESLFLAQSSFAADRDLWLGFEDHILRNRKSLSVSDIARLVCICDNIVPSQLFWQELEQLVIMKSGELRKDPESLYKIVHGMRGQRNETFWKIMSGLLTKNREAFAPEQLIQILLVLDAADGRAIYEHLYGSYVMRITNGEIQIVRDVHKITDLVLALHRHSAPNTEFLAAMIKWLASQVPELALRTSKSELVATAELLMRMSEVKAASI